MYVILSVHVHEPTEITYVDRWDHIREAKADDARKCLGSLVLLLELRSFTLICGMWGTEKVIIENVSMSIITLLSLRIVTFTFLVDRVLTAKSDK